MKRLCIIVLMAVAIASCTACKKDQTDNTGNADLIGQWELRMVQAGMLPVQEYGTGNGNGIRFSATNYEIFKDNQVTQTGTYTVVADTTVEANVCLDLPPNEFRNRIIYDNDVTANKVFIQISGNKLIVLSGCFAVDGGNRREYQKQLTNK